MERRIDARAAARLLEVRTIEVVSGRGRSIIMSNVRCPARRRTAAVEECAHCAQSEGLARDALARGEWLACHSPACAGASGGDGGEGPRVVDVMRPAGVALRSTLARSTAADALRSRRQSGALVVDGEGRPVGMVGEAELLRAKSGARVSDVMTRVALAVHETAPIARAAALMAEHGTDRVAVVSGDGMVVGVLSALDVVAWAAAAAGALLGAGVADGTA